MVHEAGGTTEGGTVDDVEISSGYILHGTFFAAEFVEGVEIGVWAFCGEGFAAGCFRINYHFA